MLLETGLFYSALSAINAGNYSHGINSFVMVGSAMYNRVLPGRNVMFFTIILGGIVEITFLA